MTQKKKIPKLARQGDILFLPIDKIPRNTRTLSPAERYIVAEGEATGHHHAVIHADGLSVHQRGEDRFWLNLSGDNGTLIEHPEHAPITLDAGRYEVRRQREYDPSSIGRGFRNVYD